MSIARFCNPFLRSKFHAQILRATFGMFRATLDYFRANFTPLRAIAGTFRAKIKSFRAIFEIINKNDKKILKSS